MQKERFFINILLLENFYISQGFSHILLAQKIRFFTKCLLVSGINDKEMRVIHFLISCNT